MFRRRVWASTGWATTTVGKAAVESVEGDAGAVGIESFLNAMSRQTAEEVRSEVRGKRHQENKRKWPSQRRQRWRKTLEQQMEPDIESGTPIKGKNVIRANQERRGERSDSRRFETFGEGATSQSVTQVHTDGSWMIYFICYPVVLIYARPGDILFSLRFFSPSSIAYLNFHKLLFA